MESFSLKVLQDVVVDNLEVLSRFLVIGSIVSIFASFGVILTKGNLLSKDKLNEHPQSLIFIVFGFISIGLRSFEFIQFFGGGLDSLQKSTKFYEALSDMIRTPTHLIVLKLSLSSILIMSAFIIQEATKRKIHLATAYMILGMAFSPAAMCSLFFAQVLQNPIREQPRAVSVLPFLSLVFALLEGVLTIYDFGRTRGTNEFTVGLNFLVFAICLTVPSILCDLLPKPLAEPASRPAQFMIFFLYSWWALAQHFSAYYTMKSVVYLSKKRTIEALEMQFIGDSNELARYVALDLLIMMISLSVFVIVDLEIKKFWFFVFPLGVLVFSPATAICFWIIQRNYFRYHMGELAGAVNSVCPVLPIPEDDPKLGGIVEGRQLFNVPQKFESAPLTSSELADAWSKQDYGYSGSLGGGNTTTIQEEEEEEEHLTSNNKKKND